MYANGYPIQAPLASRICAISGGMPGGALQLRETPVKLYHRVNVPNTGPAELQFFNVPKAKGITNLDQANTIPANQVLYLMAMRFRFDYGVDQNGSRATVFAGGGAIGQTTLSRGGAGAVITDTLIDSVWKAHECIRQLMDTATVTFNIGNNLIYEVAGLTSFPDGRGMCADATSAQAMTAAAASNEIAHAITQLRNGAPVLDNAFRFHTPYPLVAGQTFELKVSWNTAVNFQDATIGPLVGATAGAPCGTLIAELEGVLGKPASS